METARQQMTISTVVQAPLATVWEHWTKPEHIKEWNAASDDWCCPSATNDLRIGGSFSARMEARDKSAGFDFGGVYSEVIPHEKLAYHMEDGRAVQVQFEETADGVKVTETFDIEDLNSAEMQRSGWQAILDRFKAQTEHNQA